MKRYKQRALNTLAGNWWKEIGYFTLLMVTQLVMSGVQEMYPENAIIQILLSLITFPLSIGYARHIIKLVRNEYTNINDLFYYYFSTEVFEVFILGLAVGLITFLWSLILIIPGIIAALSYTLAQTIKIENPSMDINEALRTSKQAMYGHKWEYFLLGISFIGWYIVGVLPAIFIIPLAGTLPALLVIVAILGILPVSIYEAVTMVAFHVETIDNFFGTPKYESQFETTGDILK